MRTRNAVLWAGLLLVVALCDAWVIGSEPSLPARVMTRWTSTRPTSFMTRDEWIRLALLFVTVPSLGTALALFVAARRWPRTFFRALATASPAVRAEMLPVLDATSFVLAALIAVWFAVFHAIVLDANATSPPTTPVTPVLVWAATMAGIGVVMGLVVGTCITRAARRTG